MITGKTLFPLLALLLSGLPCPPVQAEMLDYSYTGWPFYGYALTIDLQIDSALISGDGHFQRYLDLTTENAPFQRFVISDGVAEISDSRLDFDYQHVKYLDVSFDLDDLGEIVTWSIKATDGYQSPGGSNYYLIESVFSGVDGDHDSVALKSVDPFDNFSTQTLLSETSAAGYWTRSAAPVGAVPLPGAWLLFTFGLMTLIPRHYRRRA